MEQNQDIKDLIQKYNVPVCIIADEMGTTSRYLRMMLERKLTDGEKNQLLELVEEIHQSEQYLDEAIKRAKSSC